MNDALLGVIVILAALVVGFVAGMLFAIYL